MKFCHVTLSVKDMEASLKFYQEMVGLKLNRRWSSGPGSDLAFLGNGETEVELICRDSYEGSGLGKGVSLGFETTSLEDKIAQLRENGYETNGVISSPNPEVSFFFAKDPDGYNIQFVKA